MNYNSILLRLPAVVRGRFNFNGLLHFAVLLLLGFSTPVQAQIQPKDVGPLDERLTMPRNPVARNAGVWNGGSEDGGDMTFSMMQFRKNGFLGNEYTSCFGFAFFHQQHIVRLPDKNGHAYFMVTASKAYVPDDPFAARIADGRLVVYRTDRVDPATGLIPPSNRPDGTDGQIVWEYRFASTLPVGWWNHPCKMEAIGGLLMISMQMWDGEGGICSHDSGQIYGEDEALVFYDVRDPENPKYWGKMTKTELSGDGLNYGTPGYISHLNNASLVQAGDEWILTVGLDSSHVTDMKWWHTKNITPRLIDWTYGGTGTFSGAQQGSFFNSYESYNPPASAPAGTTLPGTERVMWGNADGDEGGGDAGEVSGDEAVYFGQLNFAPVGDPTSVNFAPTPTANVPGQINRFVYPAPNLWIAPPIAGYVENHNSKKDYDSVGVSVVRGMPVFYSPLIWYSDTSAGGGLTLLGNVPSPLDPNSDKIYQVWNPVNLALQSFPPLNQIVTTLADNGAGSLRRAISQGGNITFAPNLDGQTINLTGGPLVVYLSDVNIDASALPNGINIQIFADTTGSKPAFVVADRSLTLNDALKKTVWVTSDPGAWFGQSTNTHDGVGAFQSGAITNSQQTYLQTAVAGPGTLTFWWKASSEAGGGFLAFQMDSNSISASLAGPGDWTQVTIPVPAGTHTLKWSYSKDSANSAGSDAAFLDQVVYIPLTPKMVIEQPPGTPLVGAGVSAWGDNDQGQTTVPGGLTGLKAIAAGAFDTFALRNDGTVMAWGATTPYNTGQTMIPPGLSGVSAITAGTYHTLALKNDGTVVAWGNNSYGQTNIPPGLSGVTAISAGDSHTVAVKSDGTVVAWGDNDYGQTDVPAGLSGVMNVAAGAFHTVALKNDGTVVVWGRNIYGQTNVPVGLTGVTAIAAGAFHTVALKNDGTVVAWGNNDFNQTNAPAGLSGVTAIAAGDYYNVALRSDGTVVAWGENNYGQTDVPAGLSGVSLIAAGAYHTVAVVRTPTVAFGHQLNGISSAAKTFTIKNTGTVALNLTSVSTLNGNSGDFIVNTSGMLTSVPAGGQTTFTVTFQPTALGGRATTLSISSDGGNSSIALTGIGDFNAGVPKIALSLPIGSPRVGNVVAWGYGGAGATTVPAGLGPVRGIATAYLYSAALKTDGTVVTWGDFNGGNTNQPADVTSVVAIASAGHMVALKTDGTVVTWGGDGTEGIVPVGLNQVTAVAAGNGFTLALKQDGSVRAWGNNNLGQTNVPVAAQSGVLAIAANGAHALALKTNGSVVAWGSDTDGESTVPASALSGVIAISAGGGHSLAIKTNGSIIPWGRNVEGQATVPAEAMSGVIAVEGGIFNSVALKNDGTVLAWGYGGLGVTTIPPGLTGVVAISASGNHVLAIVGTPYLDYGNQCRNTSSAARTFTIRNSGTGPLTISSLTATNGNTNDFLLDTIGMITNVPPGSNTTFRVSFSPTALGLRSTTFHLISNDADEGDIAIALSGTGLATGASGPFPLTGMTRLPNGSFRFGFTNQSGLPFTVLTATNVALPLSNWVVLGAPIEAPPGQYQFTDPQATNDLQRFYRVHSP